MNTDSRAMPFHTGHLLGKASWLETRQAIFLLVLASMLYQMGMCFINTVAFSVNTALVGLVELMIYLGCIFYLRHAIPRYMGAFLLLTAVNLLLLTLIRGYLDPKPFRDILIVVLFFWLGMTYGSVRLVDRLVAVSLCIAIALGAFEWLAIDSYVKLFHTFSYFQNQSGIGVSGGAIFEGQALTINGFRPEGIGRTILPWVFGSHRISSIFLEPISLGNFATLVLAWSLVHYTRGGPRRYLWFMLGAATLIAYADSRFGLVISLLLLAIRFMTPRQLYSLAALAPWLMATGLVIYASVFFDGNYSDSFAGRLMQSGLALGKLDFAGLLGGQSPLRNYGDMGYAYVVTRFGLIYLLLAWLIFWRVPMPSLASRRFRVMTCLYMTMILSISGTSLFALKSAGLLWFMLGTAAVSREDAGHAIAEETVDGA
ncbi:hypothetical protein ABHF91_07625 [Pseudaeromonas sp. ZJS20]|uniref:hypothetical protein n=1 Tax=Pseudaeromonas aegiceratis TaxID=3153928 RepID=UPI00390C81C9